MTYTQHSCRKQSNSCYYSIMLIMMMIIKWPTTSPNRPGERQFFGQVIVYQGKSQYSNCTPTFSCIGKMLLLRPLLLFYLFFSLSDSFHSCSFCVKFFFSLLPSLSHVTFLSLYEILFPSTLSFFIYLSSFKQEKNKERIKSVFFFYW